MLTLRGPGGTTESIECRIPGTRWSLLLVLPVTWMWGRSAFYPDHIIHLGPLTIYRRST